MAHSLPPVPHRSSSTVGVGREEMKATGRMGVGFNSGGSTCSREAVDVDDRMLETKLVFLRQDFSGVSNR